MDLESYIKKLASDYVLKVRQKIEHNAKNIYRKNLDSAKKDYGIWQDVKIEEYRKWFNSVITEWYDDYSPTVYSRHNDLYFIFDVEKDEDMSITVIYDEKRMQGYRSGFKGGDDTESLFKLVFIEGWHGGAKSGDYTIRYTKEGIEYKDHTPHPDPGTPYYRKPVPYYTYWYKQAEKSFSPYEKIDTRIQEDMSSGVYEEKQKELINTARQNTINEINQLMSM